MERSIDDSEWIFNPLDLDFSRVFSFNLWFNDIQFKKLNISFGDLFNSLFMI